MRITHVVTTDQFAGTERYVVEVSSRLAARGHDVAVVGGEPAAMRRLLPASVTWTAGGSTRPAVRALLAGGRRDIVHSHVPKSDFIAVLASAVTGGKRVSTRHITAPRGYSPLARRVGVHLRRMVSCEIAVSRWTSDQLSTPSDVVLVNGVPSVANHDTEREPIVFVAQRLAPEKDTATAVRAWAASRLPAMGWRLVVAGSGGERAALEALSVESGVADSVDFVGWLDDPNEVFVRAGIFLAPAPTEPCGLTVLEAMSFGVPVVAAGSGGHVETVGRHPDAALFEPRDALAAAAHLDRLAGDRDVRAKYGTSLRELQRAEFDIEDHVDRLEAVYRRTLGRRGQ